ncbi:MAG: hypothetical protein WD061_03430 [Candidatus Saccharimonadales bacterium]
MPFNGEHRNSSDLVIDDTCHTEAAMRLFEREARDKGIPQDRIDEMVAENRQIISNREAQTEDRWERPTPRFAGNIAIASI